MAETKRIVVTVEDIEARSEEICELSRKANQPVFIERDGVIETVLMPLGYYRERGFDVVTPIPPEIDTLTP